MELCLSHCSLLNAAQPVQGFGLLQPLLFRVLLLHSGIACLGYVHYGIACLTSQASDWAGAFWDDLSGPWLVTLC